MAPSTLNIFFNVVEAEVVSALDWGVSDCPAASQAKKRRSDTHEADLASDEVHYVGVLFAGLGGNFLS